MPVGAGSQWTGHYLCPGLLCHSTPFVALQGCTRQQTQHTQPMLGHHSQIQGIKQTCNALQAGPFLMPTWLQRLLDLVRGMLYVFLMNKVLSAAAAATVWPLQGCTVAVNRSLQLRSDVIGNLLHLTCRMLFAATSSFGCLPSCWVLLQTFSTRCHLQQCLHCTDHSVSKPVKKHILTMLWKSIT